MFTLRLRNQRWPFSGFSRSSQDGANQPRILGASIGSDATSAQSTENSKELALIAATSARGLAPLRLYSRRTTKIFNSPERRSAGRRLRLTERLKTVDRRTAEDASVPVVRGEADREVLEALSRLDEIDREVVMLSLWEELSSPEVAEALGLTEAAVRKRKSRARRRLQKQLEPTEQVGNVIPITEAEGEAP